MPFTVTNSLLNDQDQIREAFPFYRPTGKDFAYVSSTIAFQHRSIRKAICIAFRWQPDGLGILATANAIIYKSVFGTFSSASTRNLHIEMAHGLWMSNDNGMAHAFDKQMPENTYSNDLLYRNL